MRLVLAAVAALALAAAGCGAAGSEPDLEQAVERTEAMGSFGLEMRTRLVEEGEEMEWGCTGAADRLLRRSRLVCTDGFVVLTIGGSTYYDDGTNEGKWWKVPGGEEPLAELEPENILGVLESAVRDQKRIGAEDVRGVATVHYAVTVDCERAEFFECEAETTVADVWIDDEGFVRRIGVDEGGLTMTVEYFDFGEAVDIEPPPADEVLEPPDLEPQPCNAADAGPIGVDEAVQVFRRHGFEVQVDEGTCASSVAASFSTNLPDGTMSDDDNLYCYVFTKPVPPAGSTAGSTGTPPPVDRRLENLECTLWVERQDAKAEEAAGRLDAALAELRREVGG